MPSQYDEQLAAEYNLSAALIDDALALYADTHAEMNGAINLESAIKVILEPRWKRV